MSRSSAPSLHGSGLPGCGFPVARIVLESASTTRAILPTCPPKNAPAPDRGYPDRPTGTRGSGLATHAAPTPHFFPSAGSGPHVPQSLSGTVQRFRRSIRRARLKLRHSARVPRPLRRFSESALCLHAMWSRAWPCPSTTQRLLAAFALQQTGRHCRDRCSNGWLRLAISEAPPTARKTSDPSAACRSDSSQRFPSRRVYSFQQPCWAPALAEAAHCAQPALRHEPGLDADPEPKGVSVPFSLAGRLPWTAHLYPASARIGSNPSPHQHPAPDATTLPERTDTGDQRKRHSPVVHIPAFLARPSSPSLPDCFGSGSKAAISCWLSRAAPVPLSQLWLAQRVPDI